MLHIPLLIAVALFLPIAAKAQDLPIGPVRLSVGTDQDLVMKEIKAHFELVTVTGQPNTFFLYEGKRPNMRVVGGVAFENGRLSWVQRNWGSFEGRTESVEVSKALFSAIASASESSGSAAVISTKTQRVPGVEFKTVTFEFRGRKVTLTSSDGDASHGGKQVGIEESIRLSQ